MKFNVSAGTFLSLCTIVATLSNAFAKPEAGHLNPDLIKQLAFDVLLNGEKSEQVVKRSGPISVIATDKSGQHKELVDEAVADINDAFGYGKLALRWRDEARIPKDDEIVFLLGSVSDGRLLIERAGVSSPGSFRSGSFRYWYKSHTYQSLTKGLVAIDDSLPKEDIKLLARKYLLSVLGFRGSARNLRENESFFGLNRASNLAQSSKDSKEWKMLTEVDSAMLRFADRWVAPSMTWNKIRRLFDRKRFDLEESFRTPRADEMRNPAADEDPRKVTNAASHTRQVESPSYSEMPRKREAILACDVVVSMGDGKYGKAIARLPKGSKGQIVEEQPHQVLLFFGSDRLMYVPKEAVGHTDSTPPTELMVELLKPRDNSERIAANGLLEKRFKLNVNQMRLFRSSEGFKISATEAFAQAGVHFPEGSSAALTSPSELMVRTTPTMMSLVSAIMTAAKSSY